ncbi:MAG: pilus assembly PilX N-terminal domain-containing protein [Clostridium sp.]
MVNKRKREGSVLVTVLAITIVFMALSAAILTAIMKTTGTNENKKVRDDLIYAAESGLEIAKSQFAKGKMTIDTRSGEDDKLDEVLKSNTVERVDIFMDKVNEKEVVKSIAYGKDNNGKEMVMTQYKKNEANSSITSIFDHGIVAGKGGINLSTVGELDILESSISSGNEVIVSGEAKVPENVPNDIKNINFKNWGNPEKTVMLEKGKVTDGDGFNIGGFDFLIENKSGRYEEVRVTRVKMTLNSKHDAEKQKWVMGELKVIENGVQIEEGPFDYLKRINKNPVVSIEISGINNSGHLNIIFVNSKKFEINLFEALNVTNTVFINKGDIVVQSKPVEGKGVLMLSSSTLFGEGVVVDKGASINISHQPAKDGGHEQSHGILLEDEEKKLNELLGVLIVEFENNQQPGTGSSESIEMIDNTFSN